MDWIILVFIVPLILAPVVMLWGFAGCNQVFGLDEVTLAEPPTPPINLVAALPNLSTVSLSWQNTDPDTIGYIVERALDGGDFISIADQVADQSFVDSGVSEGMVYLYRVRAKGPVNLVSEPSNDVTVSLVFKTAFSAVNAVGDEDESGFIHAGMVQTISAQNLTASGKFIRITLRGSLAGSVQIDRLFVSQAASPSSFNPTPDPWDSAPDLTMVATNISMVAMDVITLPAVSYNFDHTQNLIIAFDLGDTGNVHSVQVSGAVWYFRANTAEAANQDRSAGYSSLDRVCLIQKIEVL